MSRLSNRSPKGPEGSPLDIMEKVESVAVIDSSKLSPGSRVRRMKQSRLPFQVLSAGTTSPADATKPSVEPAETRKRKPSAEELELGQVSKIGRVSETKHNALAETSIGTHDIGKQKIKEQEQVSVERPESSDASTDHRSNSSGKPNGLKKRHKKRLPKKHVAEKILIKLPIGKRKLLAAKSKKGNKKRSRKDVLDLNGTGSGDTIKLDDTDLSEEIDEDQTADEAEGSACKSTSYEESKQHGHLLSTVEIAVGSPDKKLMPVQEVPEKHTRSCVGTPKRHSIDEKKDSHVSRSPSTPGIIENPSPVPTDRREQMADSFTLVDLINNVEESNRKPVDVPGNIAPGGIVCDVASSEEDIYMLCTPNSKTVPTADEMIRKLTPKQIARRREQEKIHAQKMEEKEEKRRKLLEEKEERARDKEEQDRLRKREREEKEELKRKEREEKEEMKRREREEKDELRRRDREEKEKKRQAEMEQKNEEKRQKEEERRKKEEQKEEERKRKEEEKKAEIIRKQKVAQAFTSFFVKKTPNGGGIDRASDDENSFESSLGGPTSTCIEIDQQRFMPFCVKGDMRLAPVIRRVLGPLQKENLEQVLTNRIERPAKDLYLGMLKRQCHRPLKADRTWRVEEEEEDDNDDIMVVDESVCHQIEEDPAKKKQKFKAKFFLFEENRRPPFRGTWRKRSLSISARRPFVQDAKYFDYDVNSDDEWEEEEPGESLHGSDDEKDVDPEEDYEVDNEFFVPHGHLSDEELQAEEECELDDKHPEAQKAKLKILQQEFVAEMKKKTEKIKPRLIGCIWENVGKIDDDDRPAECSALIWKMLKDRAMLYDPDEPISFTLPPSVNGLRKGHDQDDDASSPGKENEKCHKKIPITNDALEDLVRLVHGNVNNRKFLVREFQVFWSNRTVTSDGGDSEMKRVETNAKETAKGKGIEFSLGSIRTKIGEIAEWGVCPLEGPMLGKLCWTVDKDVLEQYGLTELNMPNDWKYHLKGNKQARIEKKFPLKTDEDLGHTNVKKGAVKRARIDKDDPPIKASSSNGVPQAVSITKFTKVISRNKAEKLNESGINLEHTADEADNGTNHEKSSRAHPIVPATVSSTNENVLAKQTKSKKRVQLLMSVPRGHAINQSMKNNLISQFLANGSKKTVPIQKETTPGNSEEVIEID